MSHVSHVWRLTHNYTHMMGGRGKVLSIGHAVCGGDLEEGGRYGYIPAHVKLLKTSFQPSL